MAESLKSAFVTKTGGKRETYFSPLGTTGRASFTRLAAVDHLQMMYDHIVLDVIERKVCREVGR